MFRDVHASGRVAIAAIVGVSALVLLAGCVTIKTQPTAQPSPAPAPASVPAATTSTAPASAAFKVGDRVAAPFGGALYLGSVTAINGDKASVIYDDDQQTREVSLSDLTLVVPKTWNVGDKVMAVWSSAKFYPGTITAANGDTYTVKWDDGSAPTDVAAAKIFAK